MNLKELPSNDLARLCSAAGTEESWNEFVRRFTRPIQLSVARTARYWGVSTPSVLDDLVQDTLLRLVADNAKLLRNFQPREADSIVGFLKVIAANVTHDALRGENAQKRGGHLEQYVSEHGDLDSLYALPGGREAADKALQMREIDEKLQSLISDPLTERDRTIFWLYFRQGFSAKDIGTIPAVGLTVKGVESSIHRSTSRLREIFTKGFSAPKAIKKENG